MAFYVVALILVLVPYCQSMTSLEEAKECWNIYARFNQGKLTDNEENCLRMKTFLMCVNRPASDAGPSLNYARFYTFEYVVFLNKYGVCKPALELSALSKFIDKSGLREKYKSLLMDNDIPVPCARDVHNTCFTQYNKLYPNGKTCTDFSILLKCLADEAEKVSCDAPIMKHYMKFNKVVGRRVLFLMENQAPEDCDINQ